MVARAEMSQASAPKADGDFTSSNDLHPRHNPWAIALTVTMATFMEVLDTSIANVALTLSAELSANWLARWFSGVLQVMATQAEMHEDIARTLNWKRRCRPVAPTFNGLCIAPYHHFHFDELMKDMGAQRKPRNPIVANLLPISPKRYASLLSTAIDQGRSRKSFGSMKRATR
jgi:hypothetical protein